MTAQRGFIRLTRLVVLMALILLALQGLPAFAGDGDGTGGGQDAGLQLVSALPADGAAGVALDTKIVLTFNKNVVNMTVKENNAKCFSMETGGQAVPFKVVMADDQIEPEKKREIVLVPEQKLNPGTTYTVQIAADLLSKSGVTLGNQTTVTFSTAAAAKPETPTAAPTNNEAPEPETTAPAAQTQTPESTPAPPADSEDADVADPAAAQPEESSVDDSPQDSVSENETVDDVQANTTGGTNWIPAAVVIILAGAIGFFLLRMRRRD